MAEPLDCDLIEKLLGDKQEQDFCGSIEHMAVDLVLAMSEKAESSQQVWSIGGVAVDLTSADTVQHVQPVLDDLYDQFVQVVRDWAIKNRVELRPKPTAS